MKSHLALASIVGFILVIVGCAPKAIAPVSEEDNPVHHYLMGMEMIDGQDIKNALARFDRALELDREYAPAMAGKALIAAIRTETEQGQEHQSVELEQALDQLDMASSEAEGDSQKFQVRVTAIRIYTKARPKGWIKDAEKQYHKAMALNNVKMEDLPYYRAMEAASYFMGQAYCRAYQFRDAENTLAKVMSASPGRWHEPASKLFNKVHRIIRASSAFTLTDIAKQIAVKEKVCRADVAALMVDELHLDRLMAGRLGGAEQSQDKEFVPADIRDNMFKHEILIVQKWDVRGLEPYYDKISKAYLFYPDKPISRKELAFTLEDLLIKITGDKTLATRYLGQANSPYRDVAPTSSSFNAVMTTVTRGLMEPDISGVFKPDENTDGAELLLAVMRLRNLMNIK